MELKEMQNMTPQERMIFNYALSAYSFVMCDKQKYSLTEWADEIEKVYDKDEPHTAAICKILRKYSN